MPGACHFPTCPVPSCQRWSFQRWNSGQQMSLMTLMRLRGQHRWTLVTEGEKHGEGGLFDFLFYSKPCTRSLCRLLCFYTLSGCTLDGEKGRVWMSGLCDMEIDLPNPWDLTVAASRPWDLPFTSRSWDLPLTSGSWDLPLTSRSWDLTLNSRSWDLAVAMSRPWD